MEYVMQLYFAPGACSLASHITAREAGINIDLKRADTKTKKLEDGSDYLAVNSKGAVPALKLDNGQVLTEGVAIMQYLADQKPESNLAPKNGTFERYRVQEWLNYLTSDNFTVADAYMFTLLNWTNFLSIDLAAWPALKEFQARVAARPKVQEAMEAEGLTKKAA